MWFHIEIAEIRFVYFEVSGVEPVMGFIVDGPFSSSTAFACVRVFARSVVFFGNVVEPEAMNFVMREEVMRMISKKLNILYYDLHIIKEILIMHHKLYKRI